MKILQSSKIEANLTDIRSNYRFLIPTLFRLVISGTTLTTSINITKQAEQLLKQATGQIRNCYLTGC